MVLAVTTIDLVREVAGAPAPVEVITENVGEVQPIPIGDRMTPLIILFAVLMVSDKLDYGRALSICVGTFFVIAFSHIDLRRRLAAQEIFYLEYFYFAIYAGILWVSFACLLQAFEKKLELIEYRGRLLVKAVYWPVLLGGLFVRTVLTFY